MIFVFFWHITSGKIARLNKQFTQELGRCVRGKYKSKKQRQKDLPRPNLPAISTGVNQEMSSEPKSQNKPSKDKNPSMRFFELIKNDHKFKVEIAAVVAGFAVLIVYWLQLNVMQKTMRVDERPWMRISLEHTNPISKGLPVSVQIKMTNYGKTPALELEGHFSIDKVRNGEQPSLGYPLAHLFFTTGMIEPNASPQDYTIYTTDPNELSKPQPLAITPQEFEDFMNSRIFYVAYGNIAYTDFFKVKHWSRFCQFIITPVEPGHDPVAYTAKKCTDYNGIDNN
jgi:hypothetical protein